MFAEQTDHKINVGKKGRLRRLVGIIGCFILLILVILVIAKVWLVPGIIRQEVKKVLSKFCVGPVEIESVEANLSGQVYLKGINFYDEISRKWLFVEEVKANLADWPGLSPVITEIEIDGVGLQILAADGKIFLPPVRLSERSVSPSKKPDLRKLTITKAAITIIDKRGSKTVYDNFTLSAFRKNGIYELLLNRASAESTEHFLVEGRVNFENLNLDASLQMKHRFTKSEMVTALTALDMPGVSGEGSVAAELSVKGCVKKPILLQPTGTILFSDWTIESENEVISKFDTTIEVSNRGISLDNLAVRDANGLEWLSAKTSKLTFENWPGLRPTLNEIETEGLALQTRLVDGKLRLPVELSSNKSVGSKSDYFNFKKLVVRNASFGLADRQGSKIDCDYLSLQPAGQEGFYDILLTCKGPEERDRISLKGAVNPASSEVSLSLEMDHTAKKQETAIVFAALGMPQASAEGKLVADLRIAGRLNEPSELQLNGSAKFDEFVLFVRDKVLANNLFTIAEVKDHLLSFNEFNAVVCNGPVEGSIYIESKQNRLIRLSGQFLGRKMNFVELTSILGEGGKKATKGSVTLKYNFTAAGSGLKSLSGYGSIFLDDADITVLPIIPFIFSNIGLAKLDPLRMADVECIFSMAGPVVKIQSAHIANTYAAVVAEPGGTIDLQTKQVEMYVNAVPLEKIESIIRQLPILDIFFNLKDKLTRLYIKGNWSDPPTKLITKRPIEDIKEGTVGFLQDVVKNGGQISQAMLKGFGVIFKAPANSKK
ncbi:MAG TPA: hypothetical protein VMW72_24405 [Sedimentisphaerales bacterium]|nr:hypothetical protein [Sedimentisphaerales bacterium]